jgi:hypothetical protein
MKLFGVLLISLGIVSSAFAQQDSATPFGQVTVTPDTVAIHMKQLDPCPPADGTPAMPPMGMPSAELVGIRIQNNLDHPLTIQYMTLETDSDVLNVSTEDDVKAMFPQETIPAHSSVTSVCGLRVGNIDVGIEPGPATISASLNVLGEAKDSHGQASLYENTAKVTLTWDGTGESSLKESRRP